MSAHANQDLQASHEIITFLEKAKSNAEGIIEGLPDVFCVIDGNGRIFKCNQVLAALFGHDQEAILGLRLSTLFRDETWQIFETQFSTVKHGAEALNALVEFELLLDASPSSVRVMFWNIRPLKGLAAQRSPLYCVVGRDITELRAFEKRLTEIYSSIPLAIFTLGPDMKVEEPYSVFSRWLLGRDDIGQVPLEDLLFTPSWESLDDQGRQAVRNLPRIFSAPVGEFDVICESFPSRIYYRLPAGNEDQGRWLGVKYQAISYGGQVSRLMIIVEDRTMFVEAQKRREIGK